MESQLTLSELERIVATLSDEQKIATINKHTLTDPDREIARLIMRLCVELLTMRDSEQFADSHLLRRELYATQQFIQLYIIVKDNEKRAQLLDLVKRVYRLRYEELVATEKPKLMGKPIAQMTGEDFKLYLEIIGIIKPLWAR